MRSNFDSALPRNQNNEGTEANELRHEKSIKPPPTTYNISKRDIFKKTLIIL